MTQPAQYISGRTVQEQMDQLIGYVDTRAAEVATDAIASDVAQVHQDMLDADADATAAAASAAAAAGTLANAVKKTGEASQSIAGDIAISGDLSVSGDAGVQGQLSVLGGCDLRAPVKIPVTPTNDDDAASKKYVDDSLDNYAPMVRTTDNQTIAGNKTFSNPISGTISLMRNKNINNISVKVGVATGTGAYKYGSVFYIVIVRNTPYFVSMSSGSSAPKHDTINVLNLATGSPVNTADLDWKMGYYIDADSQIFVTMTGPAANRISWVHFMGGTQGGSSGLIVNPTTNDTVPTADVVSFW